MTPKSNPGLTRFQWIALLAVLLGVFLFAEGPIWEHPWDVDRAAWWSYLPIPFLVAGALAWKKRLRAPALLVDTIGVTMAKFAITYVVAIGLWVASGGPPPRPALAATAFATRVAKRPPRRTEVPHETGTIEGRVLSPDGTPDAGALVWISRGLERYRFASPADPIRLVHDGRRLSPDHAFVEVGQPIRVTASDGRLHTLHAKREDGRLAFNVPILPGGAARPFAPREEAGLVRIDCTVHADEDPAWLVVTRHPFHQATAADGRFRFERVPAGRVGIAAWDGAKRERSIDVPAGGIARIEL